MGDRREVIKYAIEIGVRLIIITGDMEVSPDLIKQAEKNRVNIMKGRDIMMFSDDDYLNDCKEDIEHSKHSKFPIISSEKKYLGMLNRNNLINPQRKKVILVDHNEMNQSADGLDEAEILEVIDHHKIGDIRTSIPISFRNTPVGSSNTIIYQMYMENNIKIEKNTAGLMISGIISDTLLFKSPTTTEADRRTVDELLIRNGNVQSRYSP